MNLRRIPQAPPSRNRGTGSVSRRPTSQDDPRNRDGQSDAGPAGVTGTDDAALIRQVQSGEVRVFAELIRRYQDRVYNTCWRFCGHAEDARDLTQDTFLHAFRRIGEFRLDSRFYTWLFRIAVNLSISHRRKARHRAAWSLDGASGNDDASGSPGVRLADHAGEPPDERASIAEQRERLGQALRRLDEEHRTVIVLRDIEGLSYTDIAEVLDVPVGTVRSRLHRARLELSEVMRPLEAQRKHA
ncbi:MAG: RNA polymerase sigma-H factor [Planctomycetota bacterium]|nr:MAG: RNA polymerase sigma-H factor [Planctomycetota bacterium]